MKPMFRRTPIRKASSLNLVSGADFGFVSGSLANAKGGSNQGSGFVAGAPVISNGVIQSIPIANPGAGYQAGANMQLSIAGDGAQGKCYATTNSAGQVSQILMQGGGYGYTFANCTVPVADVVTMWLSLGNEFEDYESLVLQVIDHGGVNNFLGWASDDGMNREALLQRPSGEFFNIASGASGSGNVSARVLVMSRFVMLKITLALDAYQSTRIVATMGHWA